MQTHIVPHETLVQTAAEALDKAFASQDGKEFLFLSSGGSALALLDLIDPANFGPRSTVGVLDERYSTDPKINNFAQLEKTSFFQEIKSRGAHFIDTKILPNESLEEAAERYETALKDFVGKVPKQKPRTIIATAGIGPDAHTGGIMPFPEDPEFFAQTFDNPSKWVAAYDAKDKSEYRLRITGTVPIYRKIDTAILLVSDESKRQALTKLLATKGSLAESPCRVWRNVPGAELYTDVRV